MKTRFVAVIAASMLGLAAPASAWAFSYGVPVERQAPAAAYAPSGFGGLGVHDDPRHTRCPMSSAAEGNANQQHFPVKQYGQTSGGNRC